MLSVNPSFLFSTKHPSHQRRSGSNMWKQFSRQEDWILKPDMRKSKIVQVPESHHKINRAVMFLCENGAKNRELNSWVKAGMQFDVEMEMSGIFFCVCYGDASTRRSIGHV